jgi:hypothetical protein
VKNLKILDVKLKKDTEKYKFFSVHYTPWWNSDSIKFRNGFIMKETDDCFWSDNGKRLNAWTERAVLALVEWHENHPF